jgi:hypothetical protein
VKYIPINYVPEAGWDQLTPEQQQQGMAAAYVFNEVLTNAGVFLGGNRLQPSDAATTIRMVNGKTQVLGGPYADTRRYGTRSRSMKRRRCCGVRPPLASLDISTGSGAPVSACGAVPHRA